MIYADLVTSAAATAALSDLDAGQLADLPTVITAVSQHISARYRRGMAATVIVEEHELADMKRSIRFNYRPVIQVQKVESDQMALMTIYHDTSATEAMVTMNVQGEADQLTATGITLTSTMNGVAATPIVLNWAQYPTINTLISAINQLGNGWSAILQGQSTNAPQLGPMPTAAIMPDGGGRSALLGIGVQLWGYTRVLNDWVLSRGELVLFEWRTSGYSYPNRQWGNDNRTARFRVTYQAGNVTVPPDVQRATILTVRDLLDRTTREGGITALRAEDYSVVLDTCGGIPSAARNLLSRYQDRGL